MGVVVGITKVGFTVGGEAMGRCVDGICDAGSGPVGCGAWHAINIDRHTRVSDTYRGFMVGCRAPDH